MAVALIVALMPALAVAASAPGGPSLIDQTGRTFTFASLHGHPAIVTFVSAHCTDACPLVNAQFAQAAQTIAHDRLTTRLLTITLDPRHDSPGVMRTLAARFDADPRYWRLASGAPQSVDTILRAFGVIAVEGKDGYREAHTTFVYALDASGKLRRTILASTDLTSQVVALAHDLQPRGHR